MRYVLCALTFLVGCAGGPNLSTDAQAGLDSDPGMVSSLDAGVGVDVFEGTAPGHGPSGVHIDAGVLVDVGVSTEVSISIDAGKQPDAFAKVDVFIQVDAQSMIGIDAQVNVGADAKISGIDTMSASCVQQVINNGYANLSDPSISCAACVGDLNNDAGSPVYIFNDAGTTSSTIHVSQTADCKAAFDCFAAHWPCTYTTCYVGCGLGKNSYNTYLRDIGDACIAPVFSN